MAEKLGTQHCSICSNVRIESKELDCGHTFCYTCLGDYIKKKETNNLFSCPECLETINVPAGGVRELTANPDVGHGWFSVIDVKSKQRSVTGLGNKQRSVTGLGNIESPVSDLGNIESPVSDHDYIQRSATDLHYKQRSVVTDLRYKQSPVTDRDNKQRSDTVIDFKHKSVADLDNVRSSVTDVPQCEVCNGGVNSVFKCRDCKQNLCGSCRTTHDALQGCKDRVVVDVRDVLDTPREDNSEYTDMCVRHGQKKAKCYCKECQMVVCGDCFVDRHLTHSFCDLKDGQIILETIDALKSLNKDLESQAAEFQDYTDSLTRLLTDINTSSETACQNVDKQVEKVKKLAEDVKQQIRKTREDADNKLMKRKNDTEALIKEKKTSIKWSEYIINDRRIGVMLDRKPEVQQELKEGKERKLDIPEVSYPWFGETEIAKGVLGQLEKIEGPTFTTKFTFDDAKLQSNAWLAGDNDYIIQGLPWCISVKKATIGNNTTLVIYLQLRTSEQTIAFCQAKYIIKLINFKDKLQSIEKLGANEGIEFKPLVGQGLPGFIDWDRFSNKQNGFLDDNNTFQVQMTVKVMDIKRY